MSESFEGRKVVVAAGGSGMRLAAAQQVFARRGAAMITGRDQDKAWAAVEALRQNEKAWGITAELTDRDHTLEVREQVAAEHATRPYSSTARASSSRGRSASTTKPSLAIDFVVVPDRTHLL